MRGRTLMVMATVGFIVTGWASPALAKGADGATITGPGLAAPIVLDLGAPGSGERLNQLTDGSGLYLAMFGGSESSLDLLSAPPGGELGPKYEIAYHVPGSGAPGELIHQDLYPLASVGPVTYTEPGQAVYDAPSAGGWYVAPASFAGFLDRLGVPVAAPQVQPDRPGSQQEVAGPAPADPAPGASWVGIVIAGVSGVLLLLAGAVIVRRRLNAVRRGAPAVR